MLNLRGHMQERNKLPDTRQSVTKHFVMPTPGQDPDHIDVYVTVGLYDDGGPGEIFITAAKQGHTVGGLMDTWARMASLALQHGCAIGTIVAQLKGLRFEPSGWVDGQHVSSLPDMVARWLEVRFLGASEVQA